MECEQPIKNVSEPIKRVLKSVGQIVRNDKKKAFFMACLNCYANREVVLNDKDETICAVCHNPIIVHAAMKLAMQETGTKLRKLDAQELNKIEKTEEQTTIITKKKRRRRKNTSQTK